MGLLTMTSVEELKTKLKKLQTEKTQLNNELKCLKLKLELKKMNTEQSSNQETSPQLNELVAVK